MKCYLHHAAMFDVEKNDGRSTLNYTGDFTLFWFLEVKFNYL